MTNMRPPNKNTLLKVIILGDSGVGKSCLMNRFVLSRYDEGNFHTIGVEFMNKDIEIDGETYTLQIWDTAGQERFRALRTPFYRGCDVCLLCYAINDRDSLRGLKQWRNEFIAYANVDATKFPFIVVGNKNDIDPQYRQITFEEVQQWCETNGITSNIETSSKMANNVTDAFVMAIRQWKHMERIAEIELRQNNDTISLTKTIRLAQNRLCCSGGESSTASTSGDDDYMSGHTNSANGNNSPGPFRFINRQRQTSTNYQL